MVRLPNERALESGVGFWGTFIVTRADRPLAELPALAASAGRASGRGQGPDGWQGVQISKGPDGWDTGAWEDTLRALMDQTGNPVIATTILDSDCGQLVGWSPGAGRWRGWLDLKSALAYSDGSMVQGDNGTIYWDPDGQIHSVEDELTEGDRERHQRRYREEKARFLAIGPDAEGAAPLAVTWALEAGLQPDPAAVLAVLQHREVFGERQFFRLLAVPGRGSPNQAGMCVWTGSKPPGTGSRRAIGQFRTSGRPQPTPKR